MFSKTIIGGAILAVCLMLAPMPARGAGSDGTGTISITATVDTFAEWGDSANNYVIAASDFVHDTNQHDINLVNQTTTATRDLTLYSNVDVTLTATAGAHGGKLKDASGTYSLTTAYSLTGTYLAAAPTYGGLLDSSVFFTAPVQYSLTHQAGSGSYTVTLTVTASSPPAAAPEAGDYTCGLSLTAAWN
jgi:hypothetical protein